jgi:hypothetical protein
MLEWNINGSPPAGEIPITYPENLQLRVGDMLVWNGLQWSPSEIIAEGWQRIHAGNITSGTIDIARLPPLNISGGESMPPFIRSITPITPSGTQEIEILGEYFSPLTILTIPGVTVLDMVRSPNLIVATISKTGLSGNIPINLANGENTNELWIDSIKVVDVNLDPFWQYVILFLKGNAENTGTNIIDSSPRPKIINIFGNTQISSGQTKYGDASIYFDGSDYLSGSLSGSDVVNIRTDPFTIEAWLYPTTSGNLSIFGASGNDFYPLQYHGGVWYVGDGQVNIIAVGNQAPPVNQWTHMALTFDGARYKLFKNKGKIGESSTLLKNFTITSFQIGSRTSQGVYLNGYIDSLQVIKYCRPENDLDTYLNT